jgi:hypothetical protein
LLGRDGLNAVRCVFGRVVHAHQTSQVSACSHLLVDFLRHPARFVPLANEGLDLVGDPFADLCS